MADLTRREMARLARATAKVAREIDADSGWQDTYALALEFGYSAAEACTIATDLRGQRHEPPARKARLTRAGARILNQASKGERL